MKERGKLAEIIRSRKLLRDKAIIELRNMGMEVKEWWKESRKEM